MSAYIGLAVALLGALVQATILPDQPILGVRFDLVPLMVISWAVVRRFEEALLWALFGGIALDSLSAAPFGVSVAALVFATVVAGLVAGRVGRLHHFLVLAAVPVAMLVYYVVSIALLALAGMTVGIGGLIVAVVLPALLVTTLASPLVVGLMAWLSRAITPSAWAPQ